MSNSTHQIKVKGVDATGKAFDSIAARAKATGASIRAALGGALAAAGAYLSFRSVAGAVRQLGEMSDLAMKAGTSVEFLTRATTAFQVAGLNVSTESLTKAMQFMQKNTGQQGEGAFFDVTREIAAIPDAAERASAAVKVFGRSGLDLLPLVNNGAEAIEKFQTLQSILPGVSDAAAQSGDEAADALTIFGNGAQTIGLKVVGKLCALFGEEFPGGVRAGALNAINWIESFLKKAWARLDAFRKRLEATGRFFNDLFDKGLSGAVEDFGAKLIEIDMELEGKLAKIDESRQAYKADLSRLGVDDLANAFGNRQAEAAVESFGEAAARKLENRLIMAGSNDARKLQLNGPQFQNEQKKQTSLLEKIARNTEKTAEQTEGETVEVANI